MESETDFVLEFDEMRMRQADYWAVESYQNQALAESFVWNDLYDYVTGMGYDWNEVCYCRRLAKVAA